VAIELHLCPPSTQTQVALTMWAIRERNTLNYMPVLPRGWRAGASHTEPTPVTQKAPRLFTSKRGASIALAAWRAGHWSVDYGPRRSGLDDVDYDPIIEIDSVPERATANLEVVSVMVSLPPATV
jgi:hypothetical protein